MATGGVLGNGVRVGYSANSPVSWTRVAQLVEIEFPSMEADDVDVTVHGVSRFKRSMPGMIEVSEMTLTLEADLDPATTPTHTALFDLSNAGTTVWWRIEVPVDREQTEAVAFEFQGNVKTWTLATPIDDKQTVEVVVKFDGDSFVMYEPAAFSIT